MFVTVRKVWQVVAPVPLDAQVVLVQACLAVAISTGACGGLHAYNRQSRRGWLQLQHRSNDIFRLDPDFLMYFISNSLIGHFFLL